jgi:hypothetical protein
MFYEYKNILPIRSPPNLQFGRGLLGNKVKKLMEISELRRESRTAKIRSKNGTI